MALWRTRRLPAKQDWPDAREYALKVASDSYDWYRSRAILCRRSYKLLEVSLISVTAAIPVVAAITREAGLISAILGAVATILAGLRGIYRWQENFVRYSVAREAVEAERRSFTVGTAPYDDPATRAAVLVSAVTKIEQDEMKGWLALASSRPRLNERASESDSAQ